MKLTTVLLLLVVMAVAMVAEARLTPEERAARKAARKSKKQDCKYNWPGTCDEGMSPPRMIVELIPGESNPDANCPQTKVLRKCKNNNKMRCKYDRKTAMCDETMTPPMRVARLKEGSDPTCELTKVMGKCKRNKQGKVKGCKYDKKAARTAACDAGTQMKTIQLKDGQPASCPQTRQIPCKCVYDVKTATCDETTLEKTATLLSGPPSCAATKTKKVRSCNKGGRRGGGRRECKYMRGTWSDCDPVTNKKVMVKTLKRGDSESCNQTMTMEKICKGKPNRNVGCKYMRGTWSDCDPVTHKKVMVKTLKRGDPGSCNQTITEEKMCKGKRKPRKNIVCKYRRTHWSECDPISNKKVMIKTLKSGKPTVCQPTQTVEKLCKRKKKEKKKKKVPCKYKKKKWGPCNSRTNTVSRLLTLRKGNIGDCQATKIISRPCRKNKKKKSKRQKRGCKYDKSQWGPCDAATNTVTRTLTLKAGDPAICNATKIDIRKCKDKHLRPHVCKYKRGSYSECDPVTNMKVMVKMLKRGDPAHCEASQTVERKCKRKNKAPAVNRVCKYKFEDWNPCDIATNTMTRRQILKSGPSTCQQVKEYSKKCKVPCKFIHGEWSECDPETNQMTRIDTVSGESAKFCGKTRILTKKCNKKGKKCKYDVGEWGDCNIDTNKRTRIRTLISGDEDCQPEKYVSKTCTKSNGEARCFFGPWGDYDECQNGVQKKKRAVIQGGLECERKGVKLKPC